MSHLETFETAARALGVEMLGDAPIVLPSGRTLTADLWFPTVGPPRGMVVVGDSARLQPLRDELVAAGYGYSSFDATPGHVCGGADLAEMLEDWGWIAPER